MKRSTNIQDLNLISLSVDKIRTTSVFQDHDSLVQARASHVAW